MRSLILLAAFAATAHAGDKHDPKLPVYPKSESWYLKRFTQPQVNCGACFGYYRTHWTSWAEACGEPDMIYSSEVVYPKAVAKPEAKADAKTVDKIPDVKPVDPKPKVEVAPIPVPLPEPKKVEPKIEPGRSSQVPQPLPATTVSITIPDPTQGIPLIPALPTVNIK